MAKRLSKQARDLLVRLGTEPDLLLAFIKDPEHILKLLNIRDEAEKIYIRNSLALEVSKQLLVVNPAYYVYFGK